ncbi:hypothetical protein [Weeksella sp. HMSC059D05]|uniref:hypothetical protein n=1 Tax=Weeksella sp. HMSC059D05 TaxID=1715139 RepID=UPI0008A3CB9B|nr:hypothetical protein [Weeksella sp. HMSC059D05]OFM81179.1 hypothetical protein HMPREF2660_00855 [Weeksella sp. HMSC059D05]
MKKILLIIMVLGFANLSQAQTKEETIAWIKEKIEKYAFMESEVIKINECEIVIKRYLVKGRKDLWDEITLPTNPVSYGGYNLNFKSNVVKYFEGDTKKVKYEDYIHSFVDFSREDDLGVRFLKALQHLNTFCEKKTETF